MSDTDRGAAGWKPTACILCECNCGVSVDDAMRAGHLVPARLERIV